MDRMSRRASDCKACAAGSGMVDGVSQLFTLWSCSSQTP